MFRYVGGRPTPIHVDGNWCPGSRSNQSASRPFRTIESYVNPNAYCPVCGEQIFFYQSPHGGRVFFDDLGWPWPKHPCTDKRSAQGGNVRETTRRTRGGMSVFGTDGIRLEIFEIRSIEHRGDVWSIDLMRLRDRRTFFGNIPDQEIRAQKLTEADFHDAPSFLLSPLIKDQPRRLQFVCARLRRIVTLEATKA